MIEKVALTEFADEIMLAVGDVPYEIAEAYLRQAAIKFCRQTHVLKREHTLDLWCGVKEYPIPQRDGEVVVAVHKLYRGGCGSYRPISLDSNAVRVELPDRIYLDRAPAVDYEDGMHIVLSITPSQDACEIDKLLYDNYHEILTNSAIAKLLAQPAQAWSNPQAALVYEAQAQRATAAVNAERIMGGVVAPIKVRPRRFV